MENDDLAKSYLAMETALINQCAALLAADDTSDLAKQELGGAMGRYHEECRKALLSQVCRSTRLSFLDVALDELEDVYERVSKYPRVTREWMSRGFGTELAMLRSLCAQLNADWQKLGLRGYIASSEQAVPLWMDSMAVLERVVHAGRYVMLTRQQAK